MSPTVRKEETALPIMDSNVKSDVCIVRLPWRLRREADETNQQDGNEDEDRLSSSSLKRDKQ